MHSVMKQRTVPAHVPKDLVVDLDIYDVPGGEVDPHTAWRKFQGRGPLVYSPYNGGCWIPTEGEDVFNITRNTKLYSSRQLAIPDPGDEEPMLPIQADPPVHSQHRANIQPFFSPAAVEEADPKMRELTIGLIEGFKHKKSVDFVQEFALQLPVTIFLDMAGLPHTDRWLLRDMIQKFLDSADPADKKAAHDAIHDYMNGWVDKRIAEPGDDMISKVTQATVDGRLYTRSEMLSMLTTLLHAGLDTLSTMMSFVALHLARHPEDREYIRQRPDRIDAVIQELLRRFPGPNVGRVVAEDHVFRGVKLKKGDRVFLILSFFNQNPVTLSNPDEIDFSRSARHITFGAGPHTCAGALLARRQLAIFVSELVTRVPDFEIDPVRGFKLRATPMNIVDELWLKWA